MTKATIEKRAAFHDASPDRPAQDRGTRAAREHRDGAAHAAKPAKPVRRSANEITSIIGLAPIRGLSGPKVAY